MTERDRTIGQTVLSLRGSVSQQAVADQMRERGHKWSQATVWSVEKGERPLRLAEAEDLAVVLGIDMQSFSMPPVVRQMHQLVAKAAEAYDQIKFQTGIWSDVMDDREYTRDRAAELGFDVATLDALWDRFGDGPEQAVAEGRRLFGDAGDRAAYADARARQARAAKEAASDE